MVLGPFVNYFPVIDFFAASVVALGVGTLLYLRKLEVPKVTQISFALMLVAFLVAPAAILSGDYLGRSTPDIVSFSDYGGD